MFRYLFLTMFSFISLVEGSFRSDPEHGASEGIARDHPGFGAAVLVVQYGRDYREISISNGTYIAPGKVLTHSHQHMDIRKTFVLSPFAGFVSFSMTVNMSLHEGTGCFDSFKYNLNELGKGHCRKVISIAFPAGRSEVENLPVRVEANAADLQGLEFVANYEAYVQSAVTSPISILNSENLAIVGSDFCVLSIRPFVRHPIAKFYSGDARATEGKFSVAVLGYSLHTHLYDGRGHLLSCTMKGVMDQFIASGRGSVEAKITMNPRATSFSQSVRSIGEKFIAEAVCGVTSTKPAGISGDEIFDRERTDPGIQALVVKGLSGSGVYVGDELIGLVSASSKYLLTEAIESELAKAFESGDEFRITAYTAIHPSVIEHPLLNIHQSVTQQKINELLLPESASSSVAAAP